MQNKIKFISIFSLVFSIFIFFGWYNVSFSADSASCSAIGFQYCSLSDSCVNDSSACRATTQTTSSGSQTTDGSYNNADGCTGNIRYDEASARECARKAEEQGRARGYNISCSTSSTSEVVSANGNPTGQSVTSYQSLCSVNGQSGFGAANLAGYRGTGSGYTTWDPQFGTTTIFGSGFNINSGWNTLATEMRGSSGSSSGNSTSGGQVNSSLVVGGSNNSTTTSTTRQIEAINRRINEVRAGILDVYNSMYINQLNQAREYLPGSRTTIDNIINNVRNNNYGSGSNTGGSSGNGSGTGTGSSGSGGGSTSGGSSSQCFAFNRDLSLNSSGDDVVALSKILIKEGLMDKFEGNVYNSSMQSAVSRFQEKYKEDILLPLDLARGTGIFATRTRDYITRNRLNCNLDTTTPTPSGTDDASVGGNGEPMSFRYLKVSSFEKGWVSWREIEVYGEDNQKLTGIRATASATYDGTWQSPRINPTVASNVLDGNSDTVWNAGETNSACNAGVYSIDCPNSPRSAWILLDLGSVKKVSRIRLQENGQTLTEESRLQISNRGTVFKDLTKFTQPIADSEWLEYPISNIARPEPEIAVKVLALPTIFAGTENAPQAQQAQYQNSILPELNSLKFANTGKSEITVKVTPGNKNDQYITYLLKTKPGTGEYLTIKKEMKEDPSLGTPDSTSSAACQIGTRYYELSMFPQWSTYRGMGVVNFTMDEDVYPELNITRPANFGSAISGYPGDCNIGKVYTTTFTWHQKATGKKAVWQTVVKFTK